MGQKKAISYAIFGANRAVRYDNCFPFDSYITGLMLSLRLNRLVYPKWTIVIETDHSTYGMYQKLFDYLVEKKIIVLEINKDDAPLCEAMLWRLKPLWHRDWDEVNQGYQGWTYSHVICRDLDSLPTYRDAQCVQMWINNGRAAHAITDSVSHDVAMMGGMIGLMPRYFSAAITSQTFDEMIMRCNVDLTVKGSDQTLINRFILPLFAQKGTDSITQHYFKGRGDSFLQDFHTCNCWINSCRIGHKEGCPLDIPVDDISVDMKETDEISEHLGASGWNQQQTERLIFKHREKFNDLIEIEKEYPHVFSWIKK